ncbi:MAG: hypothetical protein WCO00_01280 [Rhodospirillaceae bacterium]
MGGFGGQHLGDVGAAQPGEDLPLHAGQGAVETLAQIIDIIETQPLSGQNTTPYDRGGKRDQPDINSEGGLQVDRTDAVGQQTAGPSRRSGDAEQTKQWHQQQQASAFGQSRRRRRCHHQPQTLAAEAKQIAEQDGELTESRITIGNSGIHSHFLPAPSSPASCRSP